MMPHSRATAVLLFLSLLIVCPSVLSVGFGELPGNREVVYQQGEEVRIPFYVINGNHIGVTVSTLHVSDPATAGTDVDDNMIAHASIVDPNPGAGQRRVELVLNFPDHGMLPGTYALDVYATDYSGVPTSATVAAIATVKFRVTVWVLSPEPLVHVTGVGAPAIAEGLDANVTVSYISRSEQDISVLTHVRIVDKNGTVLTTAQGIPRRLASAQAGEDRIIVSTASLPGGEYDIYGTVEYASTQAEGGPSTLKIGTLHVTIPAHTQELVYNITNPFLFTVENQWNRELQDVFVNATFGRQNKKTASLTIPPFGETRYEVYFDRDEDLMPGPAIVGMLVTFKDYDPISKSYVDKQEAFSLPITIVPPPTVEHPFPLRTLLLGGLAIVVLALLLVIIVMLRRRTPPPQQPSPLPPGSA